MQKHMRMNLSRSRYRLLLSGLILGLMTVVATYTTAHVQAQAEGPIQSTTGVLSHQVWSSENGLPQNSVHQILQTRDGYIWIATEGGVARFNGTQFTVFNQENNPTFTSNDICCLAEDRSGILWIGTADGLLRYTKGAFRRYTVADGLPAPVVSSLAPTDDGFMLVLTSGGLASYDGLKFASLAVSPSAIGSGPNGSVWLATATGLFSYDQRHLRAVPLTNLPTEPIEGLGLLKDGSLWVRTRTALLLWNRGRLSTWHTGRELPGTRVQSFLADSRGNLWVGTDQGLVLLSSDKTQLEIQPVLIQPILGATSVLTIFEDQEHNLWIGTDTAGLHILRQQKFRTLPPLSGYAITAITQTTDGAIWSGSKAEGLFRYEAGQIIHLSIKDGLLSDVILTLAADRNGSLWIGTPDGLSHLQDGKIKSYTSAEGLPDDFIRSLFSDIDGSLWVGTRRGLAHWKDGRFTILSRANGLKSDLIGAILRSSSNDLWVATLDGLVRIRDGKLTTFTKANGLSGEVITSLLEDANHTLWVGTKDGGLSRSSGNGFSPIRAHDLPNEIDAIVEDTKGYLWFTSNHGIMRVLAAELMACGAASECHPQITSFGASDGMPTEETSASGHPGAWKTSDGQLWFATRKGVAVVNPINLPESHAPPTVIIERFTVDDTEWKFDGTEAIVPPGHVRYAFEYAGLSYASPSRIRYRYMLEGFDKQWIQAGSRRNAYYTNLPPRTYRFKVQAANRNGVWNETGAELSFVIRPPFYRTLWFLGLAAILLAGLVFAVYKMRVRVIRSQFDAVLAERTRIAREIHDTLAQGFVGVSTQLELTAHLLAQSHVLEATQQVDRTRALVREGLADARRSIWDLRADGTQATLPLRLTNLIQQSSTEDLNTNIDIGGTYRALPPALENEVLRIAQEALANVVRHSGATRVELDLRYHPNELTLTISDNGVGFQSTDTTLPAQGHFGLQGMRERAVQIGATLNVESSPESGTTVTLCAPLPNEKE
jgi:ligand-binding sensor domain-containing protein/signal transduction histidine kinase